MAFRLNLVLIILVGLLLHQCSSIQTYDLTYNEEHSPFTFLSIGTYANGTMLAQIKFNNKKDLSFRLIHPNGAITFIDRELPCNTCDDYNSNLLNPNYILIYYKESKNKDFVGILIDWAGNIVSNYLFGKSDRDFSIVTNEKDGRFLVTNYNETSNELLFNEYIVNSYGKIEYITSKNLIINNNGKKVGNLMNFNTFLFDNAWGIIFKFNAQDVFFSIIGTDSQNRTLNPLKLTDIKNLNIACTINNKTYHCLYVTPSTGQLKLISINNLIILNNTFNYSLNNLTSDCFDCLNSFTIIRTLPVGFLVTTSIASKSRPKYLLFNINYINHHNWTNTFGEHIGDDDNNNSNNIFILPNITMVQAIRNHKKVIFKATDLSSKIPEETCNNRYIRHVYPSITDNINIGATEMNIMFSIPIDLTATTNISIYTNTDNTDNTDQYILRQSFTCTNPHCAISSDDSYSLKINLPSVTFNVPDTLYYVKIDDNFVKYKYHEGLPVPGIKIGSWIIKTLPSDKPVETSETDLIIGKLCLNSEGTKKYKNEKNEKKDDFFKQMEVELSKSIPIDNSRIHKSSIFLEYDTKLLLISFMINPPKENSFDKKSASEALDDLNSLIKSGSTTSLDDNNSYTRFIDKDYGFKKTSSLWENIKISLQDLSNVDSLIIITIIIFPILIIIMYFFGRYKSKEGYNKIVFKVALIIIDLINDIRFVVLLKDSQYISYYLRCLYISSIVFLTFPFIINAFLAYIIFVSEAQKPEFNEWFNKYLKPVATITVLSSGDIELLHIFDSKFGGYKIFSVSYSQFTLNLISWGGFLNIITEELPQLIIQILYAIKFGALSYDITILFTLITSALILFVSIIEFSYHFFVNNNKSHKIQPGYTDNNARDTVCSLYDVRPIIV